MAFSMQSFFLVTLFAASTHSLPYFPEHEAYNLNQNKTATKPIEYWGEWTGHAFHPSPENWRMPFYSLFLDRFVNGDPSNDNSNGTAFEVDLLSTQLRVGGDIAGLVDTLDYLQGMGIKVRRSSEESQVPVLLGILMHGRHSTSPAVLSSTSPGRPILLVPWT
jgi:alpha-1,3-glucan synthase